MNVAINGMGRIGKAILRLLINEPNFKVKAINDINKDIENVVYTIKYDSINGKLAYDIYAKKNSIFINSKEIKFFSRKKINQINWKKENIDILIDSSGTYENAKILSSEKLCKLNIITHAVYDIKQYKTLVFGVNDKNFKFEKKNLISSSICDSVAFAPLYKLLDQHYNIIGGNLITLHPWLQYQNLLDGKSAQWSVPGDTNSHYALGRSSINNLIPKSTSAVNAASLVIPGIKKKISSFSYRIPTGIISSGVLNLNIKNNTNKTEVINIIQNFINKQKNRIFKINNDPLVSTDYINEKYSAIIDARFINAKNKFISIMFWYDNELGYSSKIIDILKKFKNQID